MTIWISDTETAVGGPQFDGSSGFAGAYGLRSTGNLTIQGRIVVSDGAGVGQLTGVYADGSSGEPVLHILANGGTLEVYESGPPVSITSTYAAWGFYGAKGPASFTNDGSMYVRADVPVGVELDGGGSFLNTRLFYVSSVDGTAVGLQSFGATTVTNTGYVSVSGQQPDPIVLAACGFFLSGGGMVNGGTIDVNGGNGRALGVAVNASGNPAAAPETIVNGATGTIQVTGPSGAGVLLGTNITLSNSGSITAHGGATGVTALAIAGVVSIVNAGQISASEGPAGSPSVAIGGGGTSELDIFNSGTVTADHVVDMAIGATAALHLRNTGTLNGHIVLPFNAATVGLPGAQIINSGHIVGSVTLGDVGNDLYDGRGGALSGALTLSRGKNLVYLGNDGESVFVGSVQPDSVTVVHGGTGADHFTAGGEGSVIFYVGGGDDILYGNAVIPSVVPNNTVSFAAATAGVTVDLSVTTSQNTGFGHDTITYFQNLAGSTFNDHLTGDGAANVLDGGGGSDVLTGGGGADTFRFRPGYGADEVTDFSHAQGDRIDLSVFSNLSAFSSVLAHAIQVGSNTVISLPGGGTVTLDGVTLATLQASDFILSAGVTSTVDNTFGGASTSGVAFVNTATGDFGYMTANPSGGESWHPAGPTSTQYSVIGKGDFGGSGHSSVAFRSNSTGQWGFMTPGPAGGETWHDVGPTSLAYAALGSGDFDGSGDVGIAFRNAATGAWGYMTANSSGGETWHDVGATSTAYSVVGVGDFDNSGVDSIAFRNDATGDFGYMTVNAWGGETWRPIGPTGVGYAAIGFGDFNGDGVQDVAFRSATTGDWGFMSINPGGGETWHGVGPTSLSYSVIGSADYSGDGLTDLAFRDAAGDWGYMSYNAPTGGEVWHAVGSTSMAYMAL